MGSVTVTSPDPGGQLGVFTASTSISFGGKARADSVRSRTVSTTLKGGSGSAGTKTGLNTESDGVQTCTGCVVNFTVYTQESMGSGWYSYSTYVPSSVTVRVEWTDYVPPPPPPPPPPENDGSPEVPPGEEGNSPDGQEDYGEEAKHRTTEQWVEQQVIMMKGINEKCIDTYHKNDLKFGEIKALESIVSPYIPDIESAHRMGKVAVYISSKNLNISAKVQPIFDAQIGDFVNVIATDLFLDVIDRLQSIELSASVSDQAVRWGFNIREEEE